MKIKIAWIGKTKSPAIQALTDEYLKRLSHYAETEGLSLKDEAALLKLCSADARPTKHVLILMDSKGKQLSSEDFARFLGDHQDAIRCRCCSQWAQQMDSRSRPGSRQP